MTISKESDFLSNLKSLINTPGTRVGSGFRDRQLACASHGRSCKRSRTFDLSKKVILFNPRLPNHNHCLGPQCKKVFTRLNVSSTDVTNNFGAFNAAMANMKKDETKFGFKDIGSYHGLPFRCNEDQ